MSTSSSRFLKFWCYTWIGLFILFSLLQLNDPDPEIWITWYLLAAAIHFAFLYLKLPVLIIIIYALLAISWSFLQWPVTFEGFAQEETHNMNVEEARESAGLLLTGLVTLLTLLIYKKQS